MKKTILIDVGSTVLKFFEFDIYAKLIKKQFFNRNYEQIVGTQVLALLAETLLDSADSPDIRICSSANGGLRVGIFALTDSYSINFASKAVNNAGSNVICTSKYNFDEGTLPLDGLDILVLCGGADGANNPGFEKKIRKLKKKAISYDSIIYCGNRYYDELILSVFPEAILCTNPIGEDLVWHGSDLESQIRRAYLNDLVGHKGIENLKKVANFGLMPTPSILHFTYDLIMREEVDLFFYSPFIIIDIGGATTDIYYAADLVDESDNSLPILFSNRYVFTHLGVSASEESTLSWMQDSQHLPSFLRAINESKYVEEYLLLREGKVKSATKEFLAAACFFSALVQCRDGMGNGLKLKLARLRTIVVTGGASQICSQDLLKKILLVLGSSQCEIFMDNEYLLWTIGLLNLQKMAKKDSH